MPSLFLREELDTIADALVDKGYIILEYANPLCHKLSQFVHQVEGFYPAAIGRNDQMQVIEYIRTDEILWLDEQRTLDQEFLSWMESLRQGMNERLFMGLIRYEAHYAYYQINSFYKKHLDAFRGDKNRTLTTVLYLNQDWKPTDGGNLLMYDSSDNLIEVIEPVWGRLVIFLSEEFPHEVQVAHNERYSIAGWFRVDDLQL